MATTRASSYVKTTVSIKPTPVRSTATPKAAAPITYKPPKSDPTALDRLVKISLGGPAGIRARTTSKR